MTVEWSGGGGWGHYAWLLSDALADLPSVDSVLLTRERHELGQAPHHQQVWNVWRGAPEGLTGIRRRVRVAASWLTGWCSVVAIGARERSAGRRDVFHIHGYEGPLPLLAAAALRGLGHKVVVTAHNPSPHDSGIVRRQFARVGYRLPHAVVVHSRGASTEIKRWRKRPVVREVGHPSYGALASRFPPRSGMRVKREEGFVVGILGHIKPYKGLDFSVAVLRRVMAANDDVRVRVAGHPADERTAADVLGALPESRTSQDLRYLSVREIVDETRGVDVLFLGHRSTSASGIGQLALGVGVPVVGPRMGAIAAMLTGQPDWMFPPGDVEAAARALEEVIGQLRVGADLRNRAMAAADEAGSWDDSAREHQALARALLSVQGDQGPAPSPSGG